MTANESLIDEVRRTVAATSFSGVVSLVRGNNSVYQEAFGYADHSEKRENNLDTRFGIASGTKFFTALGIGTLIDAGNLSLDTSIGEIFRTDLSYIDSRATIAQLLSHTSGIYDYYDEETGIDSANYFIEIPWSRLETPSDYLPMFENRPPKFAPGERYSYSNGGFVFLGVIIERISGQLYRDYMRENVFSPIDMDSSGFFAFDSLPDNTACGYKRTEDGALATNVDNLPVRGGGDGGAYTNLADIRTLWSAFFRGRLLSSQLVASYTTPHAVIDDRRNYGYGLYIMNYRGMDMFSYNGGDAGVGFDARYIPEKELGITVISNFTNGEEDLRSVILSHLEEILAE